MTPNSALTVVIPVRNQAAFVGAAVSSVLDQQGGSPTVVIVDDGSTDGSGDVARRAAPTAVVLRTEGLGPAGARNLGVRATTTPFLAFCDADDRWPPERCRHDLALLDANPEAPGLLGQVRFEAETAGLLDHLRFPGDEPVGRPWSLGALTVRRSVWDRIGALDERLARFEDHDWFLRAHDAGLAPRHHEPVVVLCRVASTNSTSADRVVPARERLAVLHRAAARRRSSPAPPSSG